MPLLAHFWSGFLVVAVAMCFLSSRVGGQRPKTPIITPTQVNPTSLEMQVQIPEDILGKHTYQDCYGHSVQLKLKDEDNSKFRFVQIVERKGGFIMEGLEPELVYEVRVACKSDSSPPSVGDWTEPTRFRTPKFASSSGGGSSEGKKKEESGSGTGSTIASLCATLMSISLAFVLRM